jgi:hypothetical protein
MAGVLVHTINCLTYICSLISCVYAVWNEDQLSRAKHPNLLASAEQDILLRTPAQKAELEEIHRKSVLKRLGSVTARGYTREDPNLGWGGNVRLSASCSSSILYIRVPHVYPLGMHGFFTSACRAGHHHCSVRCSTTVQPVLNSFAR